MKSLLLSGLILMSLTVEAHDKDRDDHQKHHDGKGKHHEKQQEFEVVPLNSPVKEAKAKFRLSIPSGQEVKSVFYKIEGSSKIKDQLLLKKTEIKLVAGNQIEIPVSRFVPGNYEVKVWVKLKKGDERSCQHKKKDEVPFVIDSSLEVADPGDEGNKTVAGIDTDKNGIPDHVQRFINENYSDKPLVRLAFNQYARAFQEGQLSTDNKDKSISSTRKLFKAMSCADFVFKDWKKEEQETDRVRSNFLNTTDRLIAFKKGDSHFGGQLTESKASQKSDCDFNVE